MRHIIPISGKDSAATALVQMARNPNLSYEYIYADVRMELPETYSWIDAVEAQLGIQITRVGKSLEDVIAEQNMLPSNQRRFCTRLSKIYPIQDFIGKSPATQYIGIRADEAGRIAAPQTSSNIRMEYPLVDLGIGIEDVYRILQHRNIVPPSFFWQRLYDAVMADIDDMARETVVQMPRWSRDMLFAWRSRANCFMCFYQRRYEWIGLLEHHADLYARAEALEYEYGIGDNRPCNVQFSWIPGLPLSELRNRSEEIFEKRIRAVKSLIASRMQGRIFDEMTDLMSTTSCGIYCGK